MEARTAAATQRVCPHCARLSYDTTSECPYCGRGFRRHTLAAVALMLVVFAAGILGGVALMLIAAGQELDRRLDRQVENVQRDLERDFDGVERSVRRELDRRLPPTPTPSEGP
jgi:hypothetical protein